MPDSTKISAVLAAVMVLSLTLPAWAMAYDANTAFVANELNAATQTNSTFGSFTVGWGNTIPADGGPASSFIPFTPAEYTSSFTNGIFVQGQNTNTQGFQTTAPTFVVPAAVVNDLGTTAGSGAFGLDPGEILLHPGGRNNSNGSDAFTPPIFNGVLEFTAPTTGDYLIAGHFRSLDGGSTLDEIGVNGTQVFAVTDPQLSLYGTIYPFSFVQHLTAGDKVDFAVNDGSDSIAEDSTGLFVTLTPTVTVPEPSTMVLAIFSLLGLAIVGRRAR